ncbi:2-polyprenyl-3-methyl-5-hydroxy-6-metoxy-1,4-benzoquinol methylase [Microbacterium foliorum]|uniref:hypothetical protein n=1 Tax=Microbacterium foliorum TaxID=104336 RepID=UPI00209F7DAD|nr:hypothetical protein [Microbacterium foliorum]MCP1429907.1 2-polyprenyl-3-methyl-5-hydroxy-6-metoxy-1,4-benzoquinol methylase [Microbacterium foliorum]
MNAQNVVQCHIGTDTISLARTGTHVTGADFSEPALRAAAALAERTDHRPSRCTTTTQRVVLRLQ